MRDVKVRKGEVVAYSQRRPTCGILCTRSEVQGTP